MMEHIGLHPTVSASNNSNNILIYYIRSLPFQSMFIIGVLYVFQGPTGAVGIAGGKGPTVRLILRKMSDFIN